MLTAFACPSLATHGQLMWSFIIMLCQSPLIFITIDSQSSQKQYEAAAASKRGFAVSVTDAAAKQSTFEQFRKINYKWQNRALKIFVGCLKSGEYVQIRNALIVLNKVNKVRLTCAARLPHQLALLPLLYSCNPWSTTHCAGLPDPGNHRRPAPQCGAGRGQRHPTRFNSWRSPTPSTSSSS